MTPQRATPPEDTLLVPRGVTSFGSPERTLFGDGVVLYDLGDYYAVYVFDQLTRLRDQRKDAVKDAEQLAALVRHRRTR